MDNDQTIFKNTVPETESVPLNPSQGNQAPQLVNAQQLSQSQNITPTQPTISSSPPSNGSKISISGSKNIIKILIGLVFVLIILFVSIYIAFNLIGNKNQNGPVSLTYWGLWEDSKTMQPVIADFEKANPNIKVNYIKEDIKQYRQTLITRINNGSGPDIFAYHNSWYPMFSSVLSPFPNETISKSDFINSFYPVAQSDLIKKGAIYGIPIAIDTLAMYVNKDLFNSVGIDPPKTWDDFIKDARILTVKDEEGKIKTAGAALGTYANVTHASDILSLLFLQNGVDLNDLSNYQDRAIGALNFYTSFATDHNNVWDSTLDPSILAFSKGNLATFFGYSWDYFTIKSYNQNLNFEIVAAPQLPGQSVNLASYWAIGTSVKSKHQKEAFLFAKYLSQKQTEENLYLQQSKMRAFGEPYARVDLGQTLKNNPLIFPFVSQASSAKSSFFVDSTYDNGLNQRVNSYLGNAINSILSGTSAESAFTTLTQGVAQVLLQYEGQK